ncbi:MAG: glycosyltransferase family 4 protein [Paludibacter sp.]|nr:glycosyltransferase family 4 protein [Paludibacter sp.]
MKKKYKVLIYSDCFIFGGSERLMAFLLKSKFIQVEYDLYFSYRSHNLYRSGIENEYLPLERKNFTGLFLFSNETLFFQINSLNIPELIKKIIKFPIWMIFKTGVLDIFNVLIQYFFLIYQRPDLIHINNGGYPGARSCRSMVVAAWLAGCKRIVFQVNNQASKPKNGINRFFDKWLSSKVSYFITASKLAMDVLSENRGFETYKIIQIPNTINSQDITKTKEEVYKEYNIPENAFLICEVAFLEYRKGQHLLIEALEILRNSNPDIFSKTYVLLVGSGADFNLLMVQASVHKELEKHIIFTGYKANSVDYINACNLFALPSVANEDMPLVVLTAMSLGKTILATSFAGIKEQIENGVSGILLSPNPDTLPQELAEVIAQLNNLNDKTLGKNAKSKFDSDFSDVKYAERIISLYKLIER